MRSLMIRGTTLIALLLTTAGVRADDAARMVDSWYMAYFGRHADAGGLQNWVDWLRRGMSPLEVQAQLLGSEEYEQRTGGSAEGFVAGLYGDVLGRDPSAREIDDWAVQLPRFGRVTLAERFLVTAQAELRSRPPRVAPPPRPGPPPIPPGEIPPGFIK